MIFLVSALFCFLSLMLTHGLGIRLRFFTTAWAALFYLALGWLAVYFGLAAIAGPWIGRHAQAHALLGARWLLSSELLYVLLSFVYFSEFTMVLHESPSMRILRDVLSRAEGKTTERDLRKLFTDENLLLPRLQDLVSSGYASFDGSRYVLRPNGIRIVRLIRAYREFLRLGIGG
jgi:hypothetical protein